MRAFSTASAASCTLLGASLLLLSGCNEEERKKELDTLRAELTQAYQARIDDLQSQLQTLKYNLPTEVRAQIESYVREAQARNAQPRAGTTTPSRTGTTTPGRTTAPR